MHDSTCIGHSRHCPRRGPSLRPDSSCGRTQTGRTSSTPTLTLESLTGRDSFNRYCASCHGVDGRGGGPVASALRNRPPDLTTLARREGGFPRERVFAFVEGTNRLSLTHGSGDMPVWGRTFRGLDSSEARIKVRLDNLVAYVESLQLPVDQAAPARAAEPMSGRDSSNTLCELPRRERHRRRTGQCTAAERRPDITTFSARTEACSRPSACGK